MNDRVRGWVLAIWAAFVVVVLAASAAWPPPGQGSIWAWAVGLMAFPVAGSLLLARRPRNVIGRILASVGITAGVIFVATWYALTYRQGLMSTLVEVLASVAAVPQFAGVVALLYVFPSGRPVNARHARILAVFLWCMAAIAALSVVRPGRLELTGRQNPFGLGPAWLDAFWQTSILVIPLFTVLGVWSLLVRQRRAGPVERAQLRWFLAAAAWVLAIMMANALVPESPNAIVENLAGVLIVAAFWSLPAAIVVAVTRYRLFEIDRIVSRTATYSIVAGVLVAVYAGSVVGLQAILPVQGGDAAVAGSTLAAAALFTPVRRRVQRLLDQRFNRARYQGQLVSQRFAERLREELDLEAITSDLCDAVNRTMQPVSVQLWLRR